MTYGTCDTCGKPATSFARDAIRDEQPGAEYVSYRTGEIKRGCEEHPARSVRYHANGNPESRGVYGRDY